MVRSICIVMGVSLLALSFSTLTRAEDLQKLHLPSLAPESKIGPKAQIKAPEGSRIEEYKVNGRVYMVKVIPPKPFPPYYLVDKGGTGRFTQVPQNDAEHLSVPSWVIFRW